MKRYIGGACARRGCRLLSERVVVLVLHPQGEHPTIKPYAVMLGLQVCAEHIEDVSVKDLLDEETREGLAHVYARIHNGIFPDFARTDVASAPLYCPDTQKKLRAAGFKPPRAEQVN